MNQHIRPQELFPPSSETHFPVEVAPLQVILGPRRLASNDNLVAIVRPETGGTNRVLGVVSTRYKVLLHAEFFDAVEKLICQTLGEKLAGAVVRSYSADYGAWVQREYILPKISAELVGRDPSYGSQLGFRVIASNSYNRSRSAAMYCGLIDFHCENGMVNGSFIGRKLMRHTQGLDEALFRDTLIKSITEFEIEAEEKQRWAMIDITENTALEVLQPHFSKTLALALVRRFKQEAQKRGPSVWALYSALTYFASHINEEFPIRDDHQTARFRILDRRSKEVHNFVSTPGWSRIAGPRIRAINH